MGSSGSWAPTPCSRRRTATSARRSTTRSGLVASYALGLTPVVFIITGVFFFMTAASYAEATAMYPEAGGSSSFARRAFNEFWSFFAAWGGMLTYTMTVAISAFFVPHYLGGLFWESCATRPGDIIGGAVVIVVLVGAQHARDGGVDAASTSLLAVVDFATQLLLVRRRRLRRPLARTLVDNIDLGIAPTWSQFVLAIPIGMLAYTGIETISNMAEEAKDETQDDPGGDQPRAASRCSRSTSTLPAVALSRAAGRRGAANGELRRRMLGLPEEQGGSAGDPILGLVKRWTSARCRASARSTSACSRRRSCSWPPTPG